MESTYQHFLPRHLPRQMTLSFLLLKVMLSVPLWLVHAVTPSPFNWSSSQRGVLVRLYSQKNMIVIILLGTLIVYCVTFSIITPGSRSVITKQIQHSHLSPQMLVMNNVWKHFVGLVIYYPMTRIPPSGLWYTTPWLESPSRACDILPHD